MQETVFFGPFIGEFGWELLFWQGWVRKVCRGKFKDSRKIAASVPGRQPFYPFVDEFWPLPDSFLELGVSGHGYYTDGWRGGYPGKQYEGFKLRSVVGAIRHFRLPDRNWMEKPTDGPDVEPRAEAMLASFKENLPENAVYFVPWKWNHYEADGLEFGLRIPDGIVPRSDTPVIQKIDFKYQKFDYLESTPLGERALRQIVPDGHGLIALVPRFREIRRADKNWRRQKYLDLIRHLQSSWPDFLVALIGEPGGSYFTNEVPDGCIDLINVDPERRMDIQVAALKRCVCAIGSMSGAMLVALAVGCPTLIWGFASSQARYYRENFMGTPMVYLSEIDPTVSTVVEVLQALKLMLQNWTRQLDPQAIWK